MRWSLLLVPVVVAACATSDEGAGRLPADPPLANDVAPEQQVAAPDGTRIERFEALGLSFAVPEDWVTVDGMDAGEMIDAAGDVGALDELEDAGVSEQDVADALDGARTLTVVSPDTSAGLASNLTVTELPVPGGLPSVPLLEAGVEMTGAELLGSTTTARSGLDVVAIRYRFALGDLAIEGTSAFVEVDGRGVSLTVSSSDRAEADRISELVLTTLDVLE